jgi:hypothetical protein
MGTERNQLASVGRLHIWSLSDALPEKEAFQSVRTYRDGVAKPILAETLDRSISQQSDAMSDDESSYMFMWFARASSTSANHCI